MQRPAADWQRNDRPENDPKRVAHASVTHLRRECECGWRASHAYPARLYVPLGKQGRFSILFGYGADAAQALRAYGVPVELVASGSLRELARVLEGECEEA